jgi:hypothetical protein
VVAKMQVNGGPRREEHHLWKRFDRRKTVAPAVSSSGIRECPDQAPARADQIGQIRIAGDDLRTVNRVTSGAEYLDPVEAKALVRAGLRRARDSNPKSFRITVFKCVAGRPDWS